MKPIALATEDALSEALGKRLIAELAPAFDEPMLLRKNGSGYLRSKMDSWRAMAARQCMLVLTDLDRLPCAAALRADWGGQAPMPEGLLLRVAVRSAESWFMADQEAVRALLGQRARAPADPDALAEPKQHLLRLATSAPRAVRDDLLKPRGAIASQGIGYNTLLTHCVAAHWSPARASERSASVFRARQRLREIAEA